MKFCSRFFFLLLTALFGVSAASAQLRIISPDGETVVSINIFGGAAQNRLAATRLTLYASQYSAGTGWSEAKELYQTAPGVQIADGAIKNNETGDSRTVALLLNNGRVVILSYNAQSQSATIVKVIAAPPATGGGGGISWQKVVLSDVVYVRVSNTVYSQSLTGDTWKLENTGLGNLNLQDIALDGQNRLLGGTNRWIYQLMSDGSGWQRLPGTDTTASITGIFPLRNNQLYVSGNRGTFLSTTQGATWQRDTAVLGTAAFTRLIDLNDGTLIGASNLGQASSALWKKETGATSWSRFENSFTAAAGATLRVSDLSGDQTIEIATTVGCYTSADKGAQWIYSVKGIMAEEIYGYIISPTHTFASTGTGIFRKPNGQSWEKIYPATGFISGRPLYRTTAPEGIVTQLAAAIVGQSIRQGAVLGSADNGQTWTPDTVGLSTVPFSQQLSPVLSVDNQGTKFIGVSGVNGAARVWASSGQWTLDTVGMNMADLAGTQLCTSIATDNSISNSYIAGGIYTGTQLTLRDAFLFKKIRPDSAWVADTIGLNKSVVTAMTSSKTDEMYAGSALSNGVARILKRGTNGWEQFPSPPTAISDVRAISVDESGAVYVAFSPVINTGSPNRGAYLTADGGKTWDYAGLDSITIRGLTVGADGMYGFTNRGIYKLSKQELKNPQITLSNRQIDFGSIEISKTKDTMITIGNTGNDTLRITNIRSGNTEFTAIPTAINVAPGGTKQITIRFAPATAGTKTATFRTTSNTFPDSINVTGTGMPSTTVKMTVSIKFLHFDSVTVGTNKDLFFTVKSEGTDTLRVLSIASSNMNFTINPQVFNLAPGDTQSVRVRFRPNAAGDRFGQITITSNALNDTLLFDGVGIAPASVNEELVKELALSVSPNPANSNTAVSFALKTEQYVNIRLTDALGRNISPVFAGILPEGRHSLPAIVENITGVCFLHVTTPDVTAVVSFMTIK